MGPKSVRNLTYLAVGVCVIALMYLIKQSNKVRTSAGIENSSSGNASFNSADTLGLSTTSPAAATASSDTSLFVGGSSGKLATGQTTKSIPSSGNAVAKSYSAVSKAPGATETKSDVLEIQNGTPEQATAAEEESGAATATKSIASVKAKAKSAPHHPAGAKVGQHSKVLHTPGDKGDFMVVAGSFASKDNEEAQVAKFKKLGYKFAEAVKFENTANTTVVVARYPYKGGAIAVVKALKTKKIDAFVHKKSGAVYTKEPSTLVGPPAPAHTAGSK